ncbi:unnamed protein product [Rotaria sp. Silwood2]|nr:unnamed protein product [Rotaria sp. Silwood2]CAF2866074.1 unnamed protein product [Rotaria sp. Silwood2]
MANNQWQLLKDYSSLLDSNFDILNTRPRFNAKSILNEDLDWLLLDYLKEMECIGISNEQTLNALLTMVGGLSNDSYCRHLTTGSPIWLNIFSHVLGPTASNKSYLANELIYALKTLDNKYPTVYSNRRMMDDIDHNEEQPNKKQKIESWSFLASSMTEAALSKTTNFTDAMVVNPDGDSALKNFSYYEPNTNGSAQGVSCFCNSFDGIEPGSGRVTGVELSMNDRVRPSKLTMYIASTGRKLAIPLMKMANEGGNDGIYGRVWYTYTNTVYELPDVLIEKQVSLPNLTHIAIACHQLFQSRTIEFRYGLFRSDLDDRARSEVSVHMKNARKKQKVHLPEFHTISIDQYDVLQQSPPANNNDSSDQLLSAFQLATTCINEIWVESFTLEKHVGEMWRKIPYHLPKAIATFKVVRLLFQIMGEQMLFYLNSQEGSRSYPSKLIPDTFSNKLNQVINDFFEEYTRTIEIENKKIKIILLTPNDVEVGYSWCRWKLETIATLFSTNKIQHIVDTRLGKTTTTDFSLTKTIDERRMDNAMAKILMTPTIFFTNGYLSINTSRGGSGLFKQKSVTDLKRDVIMENLLKKGFLVKCNVIQGARPSKNNNLSSSYYKQQPSYFEQSESRMKELQVLF